MSRSNRKGGVESSIKEIGAFVFVAATVWLGWQVIREPVAARLPPIQALRISPGSSIVLGRAAEVELAAKRYSSADLLARKSLSIAPFNVRALRIRGLVAAENDQTADADDILTLAGNWSLRDDPSHSWLLNYRLSRGDYGSAFAHADTLARRRIDLHPDLFRLFLTAATLDPRALRPLAELMAADPPWRRAFLSTLQQTDDGLSLAANLAVILPRRGTGAFTTSEISILYGSLLRKGRIPAMAEVRRRIGQPAPELTLVNGDFHPLSMPAPYAWRLFTGPGMTTEILADDLRPEESALRIQYDGFGSRTFAEQFIELAPGSYSLSGTYRTEVGAARGRLSWSIACFESRQTLADSRSATALDENSWHPFSINFVVTPADCSAQWLRLVPHADDHHETMVVWYDKLSIVPN